MGRHYLTLFPQKLYQDIYLYMNPIELSFQHSILVNSLLIKIS